MSMSRLSFVLALAVGLLVSGPAAAEGLLIIANPTVNVKAPMSLDRIAAIYLLRVTSWPDGTHIVPVNREATSPARKTFTARVLRQSDARLSAYWNEMHYKGKLPPVVQESEQAMLAFVRKVPGAVGYISDATAPIDVKVLGRVGEADAGRRPR